MEGSGIGQFIPLILIFVIFYFFLIRPQQKKVKEHKAMVESLKRGDKVVTSGGITGRVERLIDNDKVEVEIAENVKVGSSMCRDSCDVSCLYKVPQSTFDVKPKHPVTSNHDQLTPIRRTFSGVFACVATGDQPARAGPRETLPQRSATTPTDSPAPTPLHHYSLTRLFLDDFTHHD